MMAENVQYWDRLARKSVKQLKQIDWYCSKYKHINIKAMLVNTRSEAALLSCRVG